MEKMADSIPGSQLVDLPNARHDVHFDQFEMLMKFLGEFLNLNEISVEQ